MISALLTLALAVQPPPPPPGRGGPGGPPDRRDPIPFRVGPPPVPERDQDTDKDGLHDKWEVEGFGPLSPKIHGCKKDQPDLIICFRPKSGVPLDKLQAVIDRLKRFYAELPRRGKNGNPGLNLIPVILPHLGPEDDARSYIELYEKAMPSEWRGLAHGVMVDNHPGGGGQANRPDWCGTGYNFWTIAHEVGHQFGFGHTPLGFPGNSPLHTSLMNYDYGYQFMNDPEKVHFSTGQFSNLRLVESNLTEVLPYPLEELQFLGMQPHHFTLKALGPRETAVDWNRNGVVGERKTRANVNDGYAVELYDVIKGPRTQAPPVLVQIKKEVFVLTTETAATDRAGTDAQLSGRLSLVRVKAPRFEPMGSLGEDQVTGEVTAMADGLGFVVAHATPTGWRAAWYELRNSKPVVMQQIRSEVGTDPVLVRLPQGLAVVVRDRSTGDLALVRLRPGANAEPLGIKSTEVPGAIWNEKHGFLAVATTEVKDGLPGVLQIRHLSLDGGKWSLTESVPVSDGYPARTSARPILFFDAEGGPQGLYNLYCKGWYPTRDEPGLNFLCRQIGTAPGWRIKMMGNEWANSRSVCSALPFNNDVVYAYRWYGGPEDNTIWLSMKASGIEDYVLTDFDEVSYIFEKGLQQSLQAVRNEQWRRPRPPGQ